MRSFGVAERRARLGTRHALLGRVAGPVEAADAMVVLHATDLATIFLSAMARSVDPSIDAVATALYHERSLVRQLAMRRTLFVASRSVLPYVEWSSSVDVAAAERRRLEEFLLESDIADPNGWLQSAREEISRAMPPRGATARELTRLVPRLATRITMGAGSKHAMEAGATSRVLGVLAAEGVLMRGRPAGEWTGRQYTWHTREQWLGEAARPDVPSDTADDELVRRWLHTFGPGTYTDLKWWTGWTARKLRPALDRVGAVDVDLDGASGLCLSDDLDNDGDGTSPEPWVALLPSLDPTPMGWKDREWYLGDNAAPLFDRFGNIGPTVWADGRIVGGWAQHPDGEIVIGLLEDIGADHRALVDQEAATLERLLGASRVKPSFPTPLQKRLSS